MIILDATTTSLEVDLAGAITTSQLEFTVDGIILDDADQSVSDVFSANGATNNTTAVTMVSAPSAGFTKQIKSLTVYNADTVAATVTIQRNFNGTVRRMCVVTLEAGETLEYGD